MTFFTGKNQPANYYLPN